jgi:hypothetical protein
VSGRGNQVPLLHRFTRTTAPGDTYARSAVATVM